VFVCVYVQKWLSELDKGRHKRDALHKVLQIIHKVERKVRLHVCVLHLIPNFFLQKLLLVPNTLWVIMVQQSVHSKAFIPKRFQAFPSVPSVSKRFQAFPSVQSNKAFIMVQQSAVGPTMVQQTMVQRWSNKARLVQQSAVLVIMVQQSAVPTKRGFGHHGPTKRAPLPFLFFLLKLRHPFGNQNQTKFVLFLVVSRSFLQAERCHGEAIINRDGQNHIYIRCIYGVYTILLAGKLQNVRSYTVYIYGSGQP